MTPDVSFSDFAGTGKSFEKELEEKLGNNVMAEAMKIIEHPETHSPEAAKKPLARVFSRIYDLSDPKQRKKYESDTAKVLNNVSGNLLVLDHPKKQFVQDANGFRYVAYLEWAEFAENK